MNRHPRLAYILLAAGNSTRFGSCKQLAIIDFKRTLLEHTLEVALDVAPGELHLVLGANREAICESIDFEKDFSRIHVVINHQWEEGMGTSIAAAIKELISSSYDGAMVLLGDQVAVTSEQLKQMRDRWYDNPQKIVAAKYNDIVGSPAIFPKTFFKSLSKLEGDVGAKVLIQNALNNVEPFLLDEAKRDIDTENQLNNWQIDML